MADSNLKPVGITPTWWTKTDASFGGQILRNLYAVQLPQTEKNAFGLMELPRLKAWHVVGAGPIRMIVPRSANRAFVVSGDELYKVDAAGGATLVLTLPSANDVVCQYASSTNETAFINDGKAYWIKADESVVGAGSGSPVETGVTSVAFLKRRWIYTKQDTTSFYYSELDDPLDVPAVNIISAEGDPDNLVSAFGSGSDAFMFGGNSLEIFRTTSDPNAPYQPVAQTAQSCGSGSSVARVGQEILWLDNEGVILRAEGYSGRAVSTPAIETEIAKAADKSLIRGDAMTWQGALFYVLTIPNVGTYAYNLDTGLWTERASFERSTFRGRLIERSFGKMLVGDDETGQIWELSDDPASDADTYFERVFTLPEIHKGAEYFSLNELMIEGRMGESPAEGELSRLYCAVSKNGGVTYGQPKLADLGRRGEYDSRARFLTFGQARSFLPKFRLTDPVNFTVTAAYADVD